MINQNFSKLGSNYLFAEVARRTADYKKNNPNAEVISLGIGDVTLPLAKVVTDAIRRAADDMDDAKTFRGYGPYEGYEFARQAVRSYYKTQNSVELELDEIFIGDGAKNDLGSVLDLFEQSLRAVIPDPVYPAYLDVNLLHGNTVSFVNGTGENGFLPAPPDYEAELVYICSPNNPTGAVYTREGLKAWVDYANACGAVILFDAAYESFVRDDTLPRSIYEIPGAKRCAIELCSLSKTAGFTGVRCGYTIIPHELERDGSNLNAMWQRRAAIKYNGCSYIIQRAAEAVFSESGLAQTRANLNYYVENAKLIAKALDELGIGYTGGKCSPYIWFECPKKMPSWELFDLMLEKANVVCTPGAGFGENGEYHCRLTSFNTRENTEKAVKRLQELFGSL